MQIVAVTLLPAAHIFLILILNDEGSMGKHVNTISTIFALSTLFPDLVIEH